MARRKSRRGPGLDPILSRGIIAIVLIIVAIIFCLSFLDKAGTIGKILDEWILSFLFGSIRFTAPAILLILSWFLFKDIEYNYRPTHGIGALLFFLAMSSLMHIRFVPDDMWAQALAGHGGGVFGMLAWPLKEYLGAVAGSVILVGMVAVSVFLIFNTSFVDFVMLNRKLFSALGWLGRTVLGAMKVFVKKDDRLKINGDYSEYEDETDEEDQVDEEDEEVEESRSFARREVGQKEDNDEEDQVDEEDEEVEEKKDSSPWSRKVVVKNLPTVSLLTTKKGKPTSGDIKANAQIIHDTLAEFGIEVDMGEVRVGPTVTQYSLKPAKGVKLSRIVALSNDLSLALAAHPIRIEAPIPGQSLVGIEVPNHRAAMVALKELLESIEFRKREHNMMIALGKDVAGKVWFADLPKMPHLLVAGATGSGKTVCINSIILSLLYQNTAETLRFILVDPKRVELTLYNNIPHLLAPVVTNVQKTVNALKWTTGEMDRRFDLLSKSGARDIESYNRKFPGERLPRIVFIIDELADLMAAAASEVEAGIIRLAQMARAVGIHLIVATQRPSVDVITGLMKANIPARIAFSVASLIDSRTILDSPGAEKLLGRGDMLFQTAELSKPRRLQGAFISEEEVNNVVNYLRDDESPAYDESILEKSSAGTANMFGGLSDDHDPLFNEARQIILEAGKASASFLQRRMKIGYARAARILDELEAAGIIGPADGAKPREILSNGTEIESGMDMGGNLNVYNKGGSEDDSVEEGPEDSEDLVDEESVEDEQKDGEESKEDSDDERIVEY